MKVSYWPLPKSINGAGGFPNRAVINSRLNLSGNELKRVISNELVHVLQQIECAHKEQIEDANDWTWRGYFRFLWTYFKFHRQYGYENNPMEIDSRHWDEDLENRPAGYWKTIAESLE